MFTAPPNLSQKPSGDLTVPLHFQTIDVLAESVNNQIDWSCLQSTLDKTRPSTRCKFKAGKIAIVHSDLIGTSEHSQFNGYWGIVRHVLNSTVMLAINGELIEYYFYELHLLEDFSPSLKEVCELITRLWEVPNLPLSTQIFLKHLQQQLYFSQEDLYVLQVLRKLLFGKFEGMF